MLNQLPPNMTQNSYLEIIIGSMKSGKTSRLTEIYKQCKYCGISVVAINHEIDTRYDEKMMTTHDGIKVPCIKASKLMDLYIDEINLDTYNKIGNITSKLAVAMSDVILINEAQFFPDLEEFVKKMLEKEKKIYICGLDGDFRRNKFGHVLDLIPLCDKVVKLTSLCGICKNGTPGIFSKRITTETEQTIVGSDNYIPVCRKCYEKC